MLGLEIGAESDLFGDEEIVDGDDVSRLAAREIGEWVLPCW